MVALEEDCDIPFVSSGMLRSASCALVRFVNETNLLQQINLVAVEQCGALEIPADFKVEAFVLFLMAVPRLDYL